MNNILNSDYVQRIPSSNIAFSASVKKEMEKAKITKQETSTLATPSVEQPVSVPTPTAPSMIQSEGAGFTLTGDIVQATPAIEYSELVQVQQKRKRGRPRKSDQEKLIEQVEKKDNAPS